MLSIKQCIVKLFLLAATAGAHKTLTEMPHKDYHQQQDKEALHDSGRELENEWPRKNLGRYIRKFDRVITKDIKEIQKIIIDVNGTSVYDVLVDNQIINGFGNSSQANGLLFAYDPTVSMILSPPFSDGTYAYQGCENEEFGEDGKFNDVVCDTMDTFNDFVCMKEEACNKTVTTNMMVADGHLLSDLGITSRLICLGDLRFNVTLPICFSTDIADVPQKYLTTAAELQYLATYVLPNGYDNRLLSYTPGTMMADEPGFENTNIVNGVIGKSYLDMIEDFNPEFATLDLKTTVGWHAAGAYFSQEGYPSTFALHAANGYLMFKYSNSILTDDERKLWKKYVLQASGNNYCGVFYGIKHAVDCKTMDELLAVVDDFEDGFCLADDTLDLYYEVKQFMTKKRYWNKNCVAQ